MPLSLGPEGQGKQGAKTNKLNNLVKMKFFGLKIIVYLKINQVRIYIRKNLKF